MYSDYGVTVLSVTGFPIQKSPDQSLFSNSPKLIAAFHVFHRFLTPRHPPFVLYSLATINHKLGFKRFNANITKNYYNKFSKNMRSFDLSKLVSDKNKVVLVFLSLERR